MYTVVQRPTTRILGPDVTSLHVFMMNITSSHRSRRRARRRRLDSETFCITQQQHTGGPLWPCLLFFIQLQTLKDARSILGLNGLRNTTIVTELHPAPDIEGCKVHFGIDRAAKHHDRDWTSMDAESIERYCMLAMMIVVKPTYINHLQIQSKEYIEWPSTRDTKSETLISGSLKTRDTKKINETQAGSESIFLTGATHNPVLRSHFEASDMHLWSDVHSRIQDFILSLTLCEWPLVNPQVLIVPLARCAGLSPL